MKNQYLGMGLYRLFLRQAIVSTVPSGLLFVTMPVLAGVRDGSLVSIGIVFFVIRVAALLGALTARFWHAWMSYRAGSICCEVLSVLALALLFGAPGEVTSWKLALALGARSYLVGVLQNTRGAWLKEMPNQDHAKQAAVNIAVAQQGAFVVAGVLLVLFWHESTLFWAMVAVDIVGALASIALLRRLPDARAPVIAAARPGLRTWALAARHAVERYMHLFALTLFLAMAVGGANTLLVNFGRTYISQDVGYGVAIILYSVSFALGARFLVPTVEKVGRARLMGVGMTLTLAMAAALGGLTLGGAWQVSAAGMFLFFFFYGGVFSVQEAAWFDGVAREHASAGFALKELLMGSMIAAGEWFYAVVPGHEMQLRLGALACLAVTFGVTVRRKTTFFKHHEKR